MLYYLCNGAGYIYIYIYIYIYKIADVLIVNLFRGCQNFTPHQNLKVEKCHTTHPSYISLIVTRN